MGETAMTQTERVIAKMLKENTGSHTLDSGKAYGRHWERNQKRRFDAEPEVALEVSAHGGIDEKGKPYEYVELLPSINVYHFLSEALEYAEKLDRQFQAFARRAEFRDEAWLSIMEAFAEKQGWEDRNTFNSYNSEDWLSQVIQGVVCTGEGSQDDSFVLLHIHQGCDVRGGYGKPRAFRWSTDWSPCLWDSARATIYCAGDKFHAWQMEPGYSDGGNEEPALDSFPAHVLDKDESPIAGKLCGRDNEAYCPLCAAKLSAEF